MLYYLLQLIRSARAAHLFPYTTLFRSQRARGPRGPGAGLAAQQEVQRQAPVPDRAGRQRVRAVRGGQGRGAARVVDGDRKSTRLNSSHTVISYAVFCLKKKKKYRDSEV